MGSNMEKAYIECIITESSLQGYLFKTINYRYICPSCILHKSKKTVLDKTPFCPQCGQKVSYPQMPSGDIIKLHEFNGAFLVSKD